MRESQLGFEYDRSDVKPIRPLVLTVTAAQLIGAALGYHELASPAWLDRIWTGGALATFPGFVVGCAVQFLIRAQRFAEYRRMIWHLGLIAAFLSALALMMHLTE